MSANAPLESSGRMKQSKRESIGVKPTEDSANQKPLDKKQGRRERSGRSENHRKRDKSSADQRKK